MDGFGLGGFAQGLTAGLKTVSDLEDQRIYREDSQAKRVREDAKTALENAKLARENEAAQRAEALPHWQHAMSRLDPTVLNGQPPAQEDIARAYDLSKKLGIDPQELVRPGKGDEILAVFQRVAGGDDPNKPENFSPVKDIMNTFVQGRDYGATAKDANGFEFTVKSKEAVGWDRVVDPKTGQNGFVPRVRVSGVDAQGNQRFYDAPRTALGTGLPGDQVEVFSPEQIAAAVKPFWEVNRQLANPETYRQFVNYGTRAGGKALDAKTAYEIQSLQAQADQRNSAALLNQARAAQAEVETLRLKGLAASDPAMRDATRRLNESRIALNDAKRGNEIYGRPDAGGGGDGGGARKAYRFDPQKATRLLEASLPAPDDMAALDDPAALNNYRQGKANKFKDMNETAVWSSKLLRGQFDEDEAFAAVLHGQPKQMEVKDAAGNVTRFDGYAYGGQFYPTRPSGNAAPAGPAPANPAGGPVVTPTQTAPATAPAPAPAAPGARPKGLAAGDPAAQIDAVPYVPPPAKPPAAPVVGAAQAAPAPAQPSAPGPGRGLQAVVGPPRPAPDVVLGTVPGWQDSGIFSGRAGGKHIQIPRGAQVTGQAKGPNGETVVNFQYMPVSGPHQGRQVAGAATADGVIEARPLTTGAAPPSSAPTGQAEPRPASYATAGEYNRAHPENLLGPLAGWVDSEIGSGKPGQRPFKIPKGSKFIRRATDAGGNPAVIVEMTPKSGPKAGQVARFLISDAEIVPVRKD